MKRSLAILFALLGLSFSATAQETAQEKEVSGLGNVLSYFGKKLSNEMGSRLNLESDDTTKVEMVPTKVKVKIGPFVIERTEYRPKEKEE